VNIFIDRTKNINGLIDQNNPLTFTAGNTFPSPNDAVKVPHKEKRTRSNKKIVESDSDEDDNNNFFRHAEKRWSATPSTSDASCQQ
jgi:hypothetical protein